MGLAISIGLLAWVLRDVSFSEVVGHAREMRLGLFCVGVLLATVTFPLRAIRWRYLLRSQSGVLPLAPLWDATAIGFMANNLLPGRVGELARIVAVGKLAKMPYSACASSWVVERVFDTVTVFLLTAVALGTSGLGPDLSIGGIGLKTVAAGMGTLAVGGLVSTILAAHFHEPFMRLASRVLHVVFAEPRSTTFLKILDSVLQGLDSLTSIRRTTAVVFWSAAIWLCNGLAFWFGLAAFDLDLPLSAAFILQAVVSVAIAVPLSPGFFGQFEWAITQTLALYGTTPAAAASFAIVFHLGGFIPITLLGFHSMSRAHLHLVDLKGSEVAGGGGGEAT